MTAPETATPVPSSGTLLPIQVFCLRTEHNRSK